MSSTLSAWQHWDGRGSGCSDLCPGNDAGGPFRRFHQTTGGLTTVIYGENRAKFVTSETSLRGRRICVTGHISDYQGTPEIDLIEANQFTR